MAEFGLHQPRECESGDECADHQIDSEKFTDQHRGENHQQQYGDEHVLAGLEYLQQFAADTVDDYDRRKEVDQHNQQKERREEGTEHGRINIVENRQRPPRPFHRHADALPLELYAHCEQDDAGNVGDHRRNQHRGAEFRPGELELPDHREDDADRMRGEKRGVEQLAGEVVRQKIGVDQITGDRRNQKSEHTQRRHRFLCRGNQFEIRLHSGKRHQ